MRGAMHFEPSKGRAERDDDDDDHDPRSDVRTFRSCFDDLTWHAHVIRWPSEGVPISRVVPMFIIGRPTMKVGTTI
jgi:hypothetical protein